MSKKLRKTFVKRGTERTIEINAHLKEKSPIARIFIRYQDNGMFTIYKGFGNQDENYWELIHESQMESSLTMKKAE
tara:strand:- start:182 stop:409 length:228 start_codon:yes stop_codon:yes gene_type:complete